MSKENIILSHKSYPALEGLAVRLVVVGDAALDGAGAAGPPAEDAQQRRLAAAGRAHQRKHLAGGRRPGYTAQDLPRRTLHGHLVLHLSKLEVYRQGRAGHQLLAPRAGFDVHRALVVAEGRGVGGGDVLRRRGEAGEGEGEAEAGAGGAAERGAAADELLYVQLQLRAP
uniref:Uncharacterized protein n=1 Tax=Arundo donax TaxID=35708 RepID=A0A0A9EA20_ARUDO